MRGFSRAEIEVGVVVGALLLLALGLARHGIFYVALIIFALSGFWVGGTFVVRRSLSAWKGNFIFKNAGQ